ncbi:MAG: hypothetical protein FJX67_02265, partial [Alphaproteobacteria bacterium]|nr:hypothetical protein [Alphaproteobacteria bacterium]
MLGQVRFHTTRAVDTLMDIARSQNLGFVELVAANPGIDPWLPGDGTRIVLPSGHLVPSGPPTGLILNIADMRLYYFPASAPPETFAIGIGRDGFLTPMGRTTVVRKQKQPSWTPTASARKDNPELPPVVPPGPDNPLGDFALYLGWPTYLIHGTNKPDGVGRRVSRGCIRMYPEGIERLFSLVPVGTPVRVVNEEVKLGWVDGALFAEVHASADQADQIEEEGRFTPLLPADLEDRVRAAAGPHVERVDWRLVQRAGLERRGVPLRILRGE